jgi:flagellar basal-body rod modification protein FlgD
MNVNPSAMAASAASGNTTDISQQTNDMFLQLLTAQLQNQSPIDPVDPTQFVGQLVQFNTLDQLIQIREILQGATTAPAPAQ